MGWVALVLIGILSALLLWWRGVPRGLASMVGAALILGATGYALQGKPMVRGKPVSAATDRVEVDPGLVAFRDAIMPGDKALLIATDAQMQAGDTQGAVDALIDAIGTRPGDATLWTALGSALAAHDRQQVSPSAQFAFRRAMTLAPGQPAAPFFLGLAYVQAGEIEAARPAWQMALELTPANAPYRADIAERLSLVEGFIAMGAQRPG